MNEKTILDMLVDERAININLREKIKELNNLLNDTQQRYYRDIREPKLSKANQIMSVLEKHGLGQIIKDEVETILGEDLK